MGPKQRSSWRKRKRFLLASESSHWNLMVWTVMALRPRPVSCGRSSSNWRLRNMIWRKDRRGKGNRTNRKLSSLVLTLSHSQENTHPRSVCTPSMRGELIPEHTTTGASCTRVVGMFCAPSCWRRPGRRRWTTGPRDPKLSFPSGSEKDLARKLESPNLLMMKMKDQLKLPLVQRKRRKKRKRRNRCFAFSSTKYNTFQPAPFSHKNKISLKLLPCDNHIEFCLNSSKILKS